MTVIMKRPKRTKPFTSQRVGLAKSIDEYRRSEQSEVQAFLKAQEEALRIFYGRTNDALKRAKEAELAYTRNRFFFQQK